MEHLQLLLQSLDNVKEQIADLHESQKRLESNLENRLSEVVALSKCSITNERLEEAMKRCFRKLPALSTDPTTAAAGRHKLLLEKQPPETKEETATPSPSSSHQWTMHRISKLRGEEVHDEKVGSVEEFQEDEGDGPSTLSRQSTPRSVQLAFEDVSSEPPDEPHRPRRSLTFQPRDAALRNASLVEGGGVGLRSASVWLPTHTTMTSMSGTPKDRKLCISPLHPDSPTVHIFDYIIFLLMMCEAVLVPYQLAFDVTMRESGAIAVATVAALALWTVDLLVGFLIGVYQKGELVMDFRMIAAHYLKRDLVVNVITLLLDIVSVALACVAHTGDEHRVVRLMKLLKLSRLIRIVVKVFGTRRIFTLTDRLARAGRQQGVSTQVRAVIKVLWVFCVMVLVNHLCACIWHVIAGPSLDVWARENDLPANRRTEYGVAAYNSVVLLVTGQAVNDPTTLNEIVGGIFGAYFGLIFVGVLITSVATSIIDFHMANKEKMEKVKVLREYLEQRRVDVEVAIPVEKQVFERMQSVKPLADKDVSVLSILSPSLRAQLSSSVHGRSLRRLPLIAACNLMEDDYITEICTSVLSPEVFDPGHGVFEPGQEAVGAYFISWGTCEYTLLDAGMCPINTSSHNIYSNQQPAPVAPAVTLVSSGRWVSEVALWMTWRHRGSLECVKACELLWMPAAALTKVLQLRPVLARIARAYMKALADAIAHEPEDNLSDLHLCIDHETVIIAMPSESRRPLSEAALNQLNNGARWGLRWGVKGFQELSAEVANGRCDLIVDCDLDEVRRVVNVVALKLVRHDGWILVRIAEKHKDKIVAGFILPGTKVQGGELPAVALKRLLDNQLTSLCSNVHISQHHVVCEQRLSSTYGVNTKYVRTVFHARWRGGAHTPCGTPLTKGCPSANSVARTGFVTSVKSVAPRQARRPSLREKYEAFLVADVQDPDRGTIYAWMEEEDFDFLSKSSTGQAVANTWAHSLSTGPAERGSEREYSPAEDED